MSFLIQITNPDLFLVLFDLEVEVTFCGVTVTSTFFSLRVRISSVVSMLLSQVS